MTVFRFDPKAKLIVFHVGLAYKHEWTFRMALDTGASVSLITPETATMIGFDLASPSLVKDKIITASRSEDAIKLKIPKLVFYQETILNHAAVCAQLPRGLGVNGVLGLNFLMEFKVKLDLAEGNIEFERKFSSSTLPAF